MTPFYRRPITFKAVAIALAIPLLGLGVPLLGWQAWNARPLNIAREFDISTPTVPAPNAHDLYLQANDEFSENLNRRDLPSATLDWRDSPPQKLYPLAAKVRWVKDNQRAFDLFERGLKADYLFPPVRSAQTDGRIEEPYLLRWLARYVTVEIEVLAEQKKPEAAANRALDIWQMGIEASHGAPTTAAINATLVETFGRQELDGEIAHLNGAQAAKAAKRLEQLASTRASYGAMLREERSAKLFQWKATIEKNLHDDQRAREIEAKLEREDTVVIPDSAAPKLKGPIINWRVRRVSQQFARGMDALIEQADAPWSKRTTDLPDEMDSKMAKLITHVGKSRFFHAKADAFAQLTLARLALHAHRKDKGVYPKSLGELVPKYLREVPTDTFADGAPLRYKRSGTRYQLWSIGPDATDDNARPIIFDKARTAKGKGMVTPDANGDIVTNVNR